MFKIKIIITVILFAFAVSSCHKKNYPAATTPEKADVKKSDSVVAEKKVIKRKPKVPISKVIVVNDSAAHKSVDGRLYYDVLGHRYWRNYKDGKYYLFNKSMFNDPAFKPQ